MLLESSRQTIKSVGKWRYEVILSQDKRGIYHIVAENLLTKHAEHTAYSDLTMALYAFDARHNSFEGN